jgi:phospholipid/cholesterol/gamma-HCH transport system substrate-binding protein
LRVETKVGILFLVTILVLVGFAFVLGIVNPFNQSYTLHVHYNYAGGLEEGSPVRVMGIKVGKVKHIEFEPQFKTASGEEVKLRIDIEIDKKAWVSVRQDSRFFINLAGVIGEKFLEISSGTLSAPEYTNGADVRGEDPPRIDQLISQSYGLAGKLIEMVNKNEGSVSSVISQLDHLTSNFNKTLLLLDKTSQNKEISRLVDNAIKISDDVAYLTGKLRSEKSEETFALVIKLINRVDAVDGPALKKFFQDEGVRARIF